MSAYDLNCKFPKIQNRKQLEILIELLPLQKYLSEEFILVLNFSRSLPRILYRTFNFGFQLALLFYPFTEIETKKFKFSKKSKFLPNGHT